MDETRQSLLLRAQTGAENAWKDLTDLYRPLILGCLNRQGVPAGCPGPTDQGGSGPQKSCSSPRRLGDQDAISSVNHHRTMRATARRFRSWSTLIPRQHPLLGVADGRRRAAWTAGLVDLRKQRGGSLLQATGGRLSRLHVKG